MFLAIKSSIYMRIITTMMISDSYYNWTNIENSNGSWVMGHGQGCQSNPIERTCRLSIAEFCIDWIIDWIAQLCHRLDFYRLSIFFRFFPIFASKGE